MTFSEQIRPFPWAQYSKKLIQKIDHPHSVGYFTKDESEERGVYFAEGVEGSLKDGNLVHLYWIVDKEDGTIIDARFQVFGQSALIGAADAASELVVGKNYDQAKRITTDLIDKQVRDRSDNPAFPKETYPHLNLVLSAIEQAAESCSHIPLPEAYAAPPAPLEVGEVLEGGYPGWDDLSLKKKITVIEEVLDRDVRPYIALDAGGIEVLNLIDNREVIIRYQGSCTTCISSTGTTLAFIQKILRAKVHPEIRIIPEF